MLAALNAKMREGLSHLACKSSLYKWSLSVCLAGEEPREFIFHPRELWDGDAEKGRWLVHGGIFTFKGDQLELHNANWHPKDVSHTWLCYLHGFDWLNDLRALGGDQGRLAARAMVQNWMSSHQSWDALSWRPDILGRRISNWMAAYDFFGESASDHFQDEFFDSLLKQVRHLSRSVPGSYFGVGLLSAIKGMAYAGLTLEGRERDLETALNMLESEMKTQFHADGGHISRNADDLFEALKILVDIRGSLKQAGYPALESIQKRLETSLPALRFFRHGDKKFALFQAVQEGEEKPVQQLFQMSGVRARAVHSLTQTGYERISAGKSLLIMDCGLPAPRPYDWAAHSAPLAFEFSHGRERIFVNCGTHPTDLKWQDALRGAPAHNTLTIDDCDPCRFDKEGRIVHKPGRIHAERFTQGDVTSIEACHDGYVPLNGILHRRRVSLDQKGFELKGEEILTCPGGISRPHRVLARFHIHPRALVSLVQDGTQALLRLKSGLGFRFSVSGASLELENSIYLGQGTRPLKTKQLVLRTLMDEDALEIGWSLIKE